VATLDYSSMFARLAYAERGVQPPTGDLYAIPGLVGHRGAVKLGVRPAEVRFDEERSAEVKSAEDRVAEVCTVEVCAAEVRPAEVRPAKDRVAETRVAEVCSVELRLGRSALRATPSLMKRCIRHHHHHRDSYFSRRQNPFA
jgi:hypothetical protein